MRPSSLEAVVGQGRVHVQGDHTRVEIAGREEALRVAELCVATRTTWCAGNAPGRALSLDLRPAGKIMDLWREDLVLRVGAGATPARLDAELEPFGLCLPLELPMPDQFTLGACFSRAENGLSAPAAGGLRERCLGLLAVDGRARLAKAGARVVKNVAGYDLARLHHGAHGAFGVVLDFLLRVESRPERKLLLSWPCAHDAIASGLEARRAPRASVEPLQQLWFDPAASLAVGGPAEGMLVLHHQGWESSVRRWSVELAGDEVPAALPRDWGYANAQAGQGIFRITCAPRVWFLHWPRWRRALGEAGCGPQLLVDLLGGRHRLLLSNVDAARSFFEELLASGARWVGAPIDPGAQAIALRLKRSFDPHDLLPPLPHR